MTTERGMAYVKDLKYINRDLKQTLILDNNPNSYAVNIENGMPIKTWIDDLKDRELYNYIPILEYLSNVRNIQEVLPRMITNNEIDYTKTYSIMKTEIQGSLYPPNSTTNSNSNSSSNFGLGGSKPSINIKIINHNFNNYIVKSNENEEKRDEKLNKTHNKEISRKYNEKNEKENDNETPQNLKNPDKYEKERKQKNKTFRESFGDIQIQNSTLNNFFHTKNLSGTNKQALMNNPGNSLSKSINESFKNKLKEVKEVKGVGSDEWKNLNYNPEDSKNSENRSKKEKKYSLSKKYSNSSASNTNNNSIKENDREREKENQLSKSELLKKIQEESNKTPPPLKEKSLTRTKESMNRLDNSTPQEVFTTKNSTNGILSYSVSTNKQQTLKRNILNSTSTRYNNVNSNNPINSTSKTPSSYFHSKGNSTGATYYGNNPSASAIPENSSNKYGVQYNNINNNYGWNPYERPNTASILKQNIKNNQEKEKEEGKEDSKTPIHHSRTPSYTVGKSFTNMNNLNYTNGVGLSIPGKDTKSYLTSNSKNEKKINNTPRNYKNYYGEIKNNNIQSSQISNNNMKNISEKGNMINVINVASNINSFGTKIVSPHSQKTHSKLV